MKIISRDDTMNIKKRGNEEIESPCKGNHVKSQMTSTQAEIIHSTPNKLFKNPVFKRDKSVDTTRVGIRPQRKRTRSVNSNSGTSKLELYNTENFNNFENIHLLHDLDSVIKFEDNEDILLSSMMDISTIQKDDGLSEVNKDPVMDPLSISDYEKKDPDTLADSDSKFNKKRRIRVKSKQDKHFKKYEWSTEEEEDEEEREYLLEESKNFEGWEEMPLVDIKKLKELRIKLIHKVPPQHKIERSGSHAPTRKEKILFQKYGPIRKGLYTPTEDKIIRENWETFCELHDWDTKKAEPFLCWRHNGKYYIHDVQERQKFVQFLANKLPWRTLYSIYSRFKILYRNKITRVRYTSKEDKKILMYMQNKHLDKSDTKYNELAKILGRTNRSTSKRYRYLKNRLQNESQTELLVDVKWTLPLIKKFIKTLLNVTVSEDIRELKDATLPKPIWQKMEEKLNIHQNVLRTFWQHQLHMQLFSTGPIYLNDIKIQLIEYMYAKGISNTREIIWPNVAKYFDGATAIFLCKVFYYLVQECNMNDVDNFADVVEHLYRTKITEIQKAPTDKFLPKIMYKHGKISLLDENSETVTTNVNNYQEIDHTNSTEG